MALLIVIFLVGLVFCAGGGLEVCAAFVKRRADALRASLTRDKPRALFGVPGVAAASGWLRLGALVAVLALILGPLALLGRETRRADAAETQVVIANGNTQTQAAGANQARRQSRRADDFMRDRAADRVLLETAEHADEMDSGDAVARFARHRLLVRRLRDRAARSGDAALADYCQRNAADCGGAAARN